MEKIDEKFKINCQEPSDINEHLPTLLKYGKECEHITELGVRWVSSTWSLLLSNPKKMISIDIVKHPNIDEVIELSKEYNIDYTFIESDVLDMEIENTDLLFIDTLHTYNQLIKELELHSIKVSKYIILHDTVTFGNTDEIIYDESSNLIKNQTVTKTGLKTAALDFLNSEIGKDWLIFEEYFNNNGLLIMKKNI